jgi:ribosome biogenesis GTPase
VLTQYGWSERLQRDFAPYADQGLEPGRVIVQQRGGYRLITAAGEAEAKASGRLMKTSEGTDKPVAGDWVAFEPRTPPEPLFVQHVLPRATAFVRKAAGKGTGAQVVAANVDVAFLVTSLNSDLNLRRLERYLATTYESGARPVVVLTKADLAENVEALVAEVRTVAGDAPILPVAAKRGEGLEGVAAYLEPGSTAVLLGMSGAGKSTLLNALAGSERMSTGEIREGDERGRHTTTHRELVLLPSGGLILDTPGMRELGLWDADSGVATVFEDIEALASQCRFSDCSHGAEPGCAVRAALADGSLDPDRWASFQKLQAELAFEHRREDPKAAQENKKLWAGRHKQMRARVKQKRGFGDDG